jgi:bifunctional DNase/RNase
MPRKRKISKIPIVTFFVLVLLSILVIAVINMINLSDYVVANVLKVSGSTIILGNNCTAIVAETSPERAASIESGVKGVIEERPNTHDIFVAVLKSFNITLESVQIDNFDGKNYYANLLLKSGDKILKLDTRPSDAIALAVRTNSTIYINRTMLQEVGKNICETQG